MYIKLHFRVLGIYFTRAVHIILNIGTLEDICNELNLEYYQLNDYIKNNPGNFSELLLYYGYVSACIQDRKRPRYSRQHAKRWAKKITLEESAKLLVLMSELYGKIKGTQGPDKKKSP